MAIEATDERSWKEWNKVDAEKLESMKKAGITFEDMEKPILGPRDTNYIRMDDVKEAMVKDFTIKAT